MKLDAEKAELKKRIENFGIEKIMKYKKELKEQTNFKNFDAGFIFEVLHAVYTSKEICSWYKIYDCNDKHIETLIKSVCKELKII